MVKEAALRVSVLLVEDDEDDYLLTNDLLEDIPNVEFDLDWVSTPDDARREMRLNRHDICLLDYRLGPEEGTALLKQAPCLGFTAPIIMLTGQDDSEKDALAMKLGAVDYLLKSHLDAHQLSRAVRYALARREAEVERLKRLRAQSENDSKSQFLAHISHEIRTPLTAILGFTELMINKDPDRDVLQGLQVIQRNGQHLRSLLNDVLDFSKIEAGQLELEVAEVRLADVLADVWSIFSVAAEDKGIELLFKTSEMLPEAIMTDAVRLRQILINLIGNAVKFTHEGSVTLTVSAPPAEGGRAPNQLAFEVRDTGPGVPAEAQHLLFKPFAQAGTSLTRMEGTGLGLAISQQLAERLDGSVSFHAPEGGGACFTLRIGVGEIADAPRAPLTLDARRGIEPRRIEPALRGTVLVVDDVEDIRHLIGQWVSQTGAEVLFAADGRAAVETVSSMQAKQRAPLVILMDIQMPLMDGHEATRQIRGLGFDGPIIALTAATLQGDREKCLQSGCTSFLSKPLNPSVLVSALRRAMPEPSTIGQVVNVLLVEDDTDAADALAYLLRHLDCTVATAGSGAEAFERLQQTTPDLILLDLNLPDTHGFDLAKRIREAGFADCRICILSGEAVSLDAAKAAGANDCLLKPVDLATLRAAIS
ncbi:response regulator [Allohahella sp. A8]|uniref:response regulator n=1 Tax=Allohahella sp. A8 TaxID=3141461 RepID=UPI003A7FA281